MTPEELRLELEERVRPYHLNEWEVEEQVERLEGLSDGTQRRVLDLVSSVWPVSHALTFLFLRHVGRGLEVLGDNRLQIWVGAVLDAYEEGGLEGARDVLADGGRSFLDGLNGRFGLRLQDVASRLLPYLCGLAGRTIDLDVAARAGTDTAVVYLPGRIAIFPDAGRNFLLYKLAASFQWGLVQGGTYRAELPSGDETIDSLRRRYGKEWGSADSWLVNYFGLFPEPSLAEEIYHAAETVRITAFLQRELPGLARDTVSLRRELLKERSRRGRGGERAEVLELFRRRGLGEGPNPAEGEAAGRAYDGVTAVIERLERREATANSSVRAVAELYDRISPLKEGDDGDLLLHVGELRVAEAEAVRRRRRNEAREQFVEALAALLAGRGAGGEPAHDERQGEKPSSFGIVAEKEATAVAKDDRGAQDPDGKGETSFLTIGAMRVELPEELLPLAETIREDLGEIPETYVSGALSRAGSASIDVAAPPPAGGREVEAPVSYDEWDFRRAGFRKNWCALYELDLEPEDGSFVSATRRKYRGQLMRIRRSFEMLRTSERFLRRQREGEEIDIDAAVESVADVRAGRPASERLFVRLVRDTRDIAALFLVDMSSSTEGWVSSVIKESLVLLCEALELLGDRYSIYGFSGMRRLRSELYRIKTFADVYGGDVRGRIAAIAPRDYTRMGPPIRHAAEVLKGTEAKVRLLVTLSDGKPEDYDDYRGEYAIEDTRHALIEAKAAGVHPFCITIDREAKDYIAHMYGEVNYVTIEDARQLPFKVPEIYRILTT